MPRPCKLCPKCVQNCHRCPNKLKYRKAQKFAHIRINKQVSMSSSQAMYKKKAAMVSRQVGQGAWPQYLSQAGGPGDRQTALQQATRNPYDKSCKRNCSYRLPIFRTRTAYKGTSGVDRKHGSYARYLARRVGGILRKEQLPHIMGRTAIIKQPRNRTGTSACGNMCFIPPGSSKIRTQKKYHCASEQKCIKNDCARTPEVECNPCRKRFNF